jgi:hypothetical protein
LRGTVRATRADDFFLAKLTLKRARFRFLIAQIAQLPCVSSDPDSRKEG